MMKIQIIVRMFFLGLSAPFYAASLHCACLDESAANMPPSATQSSGQRNVDALKNFPALSDIEFKPYLPEQPEYAYLNSTYNVNNGCLGKVRKVLVDEQAKCGTDAFNFVTFVNDKNLHKKVADVAKIDEFYVRLYISRSIAWLIKACESPVEKIRVLENFKNFWNEEQRYLLFSLLEIENVFLRGLFRIKEYFSKFLFYDSQKKDFFCVPGIPVFLEIAKRVANEHLPFTVAYFIKQRNTLCWALGKLQDHECIKTSDYKKTGSPLMKFIADLERMSRSSDSGLRTLAFSSYNWLYAGLFRQEVSFLLETFSKLFSDVEKLNNWQINDKALPAKQVAHLISLFNSEGQMHMHLLIELFFDYHHLSFLAQSLIPIMSKLSGILTLFAEEGLIRDLVTADDFISNARSLKETTQQIRTMLPEFNSFLEDCASASIPFELLFDHDAKKYEAGPLHPMFHFSDLKIQSEYARSLIIKNELMLEQQKRERDLMTVVAIMKTYFSDEGTGPTKSKKKKRIPRRGFSAKNQLLTSPTDEDESNCALSSQESQKAKSPGEPSVLRYHHRVLRWFDPEYAKLHDQESVIYHTLPPFIDACLEKEGLQDKWNDNVRFSLPAKITRENGATAYVVCSCTRTKGGQIYHRGFEFSTSGEIQQKFGLACAEDLSVRGNEYQEDPFVIVFKNKRLQNHSLLFDDNKEFVMLYDPINKLYVQLFHRQAC